LEISSSSLTLQLSLLGIDELKPHEEIVETSVKSLANEIMAQGKVHDPLMVDQDSRIILDGMHRFNSLKTLKCRFAPCCLLDYDNEKIKVGSWFRLFVVNEPNKVAEGLLKTHTLTYSKRQTALENVGNNPQTIVLTGDGTAFSLSDAGPVQCARMGVLFEREMIKRGHTVEYLSEIMAIQKLKSGEVTFVISLPIFTKQQIRECGMQGNLLPHKVTRHVIPSRPLRIDVPLSLLRDPDISLSKANLRLNEILTRRRMTMRPPGSVVEGRRYEEELLVFS
jgi:hypothetical protein